MRASVSRERVRHRAAAGAAADDDDVVVLGHCAGVLDRGVDLVHQPLILDRSLEAHLRRAAFANRAEEVAIHRLIAAQVAEPGNDQLWQSVASREDKQRRSIRM